jgi:hypothetical protein
LLFEQKRKNAVNVSDQVSRVDARHPHTLDKYGFFSFHSFSVLFLFVLCSGLSSDFIPVTPTLGPPKSLFL